ncbi:CoA-transferase [Chromobacterium sp. LK11]|uniref:CaiB/BaiF CoA transferase family protein n=1 Tax=Chromobacterium sp. LK11 TaxID=1628212 RepID=UPI0006537D80|nr:CaiB/BaiF CoA-transferase family protein [Chromobacterium sp. LK11]KMN81238.1 CoA-transferase [Chromobacterium sp. LK11]
MRSALSHLRVLDLSRILAGPWCTQNLADLGADVIKVERPGSGDDTRHWGPPWLPRREGERPDSVYYASTNRNKRSIAIDIACAAGQQLVRELAARSDVLIENYKAGDLARYGLAYADLRAVNPRLVYCSITGYGHSGPYAGKPGYDFIFQGQGGLMSVTGERDELPGGGPQKAGFAVADVLTGMYAGVAILAALQARERSGAGQHIDMALLDCVVALGGNHATSYLHTGEVPRRWGNAHPNMVPYQVFATADGHIVVAAGNDGQWQRFCQAIERPELAEDARYASASGRIVHRPDLVPKLERALLLRDSADWLQRLEAAAIPSGPINDYRQVFADPQVRHRGLHANIPLPDDEAGCATVASPLRLCDTPPRYRLPPPRLGQHTGEILSGLLEKTPEDIARLRAEAVIG